MIIGELTETYPPMQDGVGRVTLAYCREMEKAGHTAYYIAPDDPGHFRMEGLRTLLYKGIHVPTQNYSVGVPDLSLEFKKQLRDIPFDILHIHSPFLSAKIAKALVEKNPQIPVVATFHSKYYDDFYRVTHNRALSNMLLHNVIRVYNRCDGVWAVNGETGRVLRDYGYTGEIRVFPNGTDLHDLHPERAEALRRELKLPGDMPVLLFVGQIDYKKNIHSILRACGILKQQGQPFVLLLIGRGGDQARLEKLRDELELGDRVRFLGFKTDPSEVRGYYNLADLFVFPSIYDNAPMVVREAAGCGTPALLIRGSCAAEGVEDGVNGYLCENTPEDIARGIREALPTCRETGLKARETIPKAWSAIVQDVLAEYQRLIEKRKANGGIR